jgi:tRNA (cmo5U34)-methyltransferase
VSASGHGFSDAAAVAGYADRPPRLVPGFLDMQRMARLLIAEHAPEDAEILVVGAGGGLEMKVFAEGSPNWRLHGVDPALPMLRLAEATLGSLTARVNLTHGYIEAAPDGPFDGAACLLTLHFVPADARLDMLRQIRRRLRPGSAFVAAHFSIPDGPGERALWMSRYAAFATGSGVPAADARQAASGILDRLPILTPDEDEALFAAAGFRQTSMFYAGFAFRGWVVRA